MPINLDFEDPFAKPKEGATGIQLDFEDPFDSKQKSATDVYSGILSPTPVTPDPGSKAREMLNKPDSGGGITGAISDLGKGLWTGVTRRVPELIGQAMEFSGIAPETGKALADWGTEGEVKKEKGLFEQTGEMIPSSSGIPLALGTAGKLISMIPHPWARVAGKGLQLASYLQPLIFGLSQAQQTKDAGEEKIKELQSKINQTTDETEKSNLQSELTRVQGSSKWAPYATGTIETAGETLANIALQHLLGPLAVTLKDAGKATLKDFARPTAKQFLKTLAIETIPTETSTEFGQQWGEALVEKKAGIRPEANPLKEGIDVLAPTALMTILTGGPAHIAQRYGTKRILDNFSKPVEGYNPQEQNHAPEISRQVQDRRAMADIMAKMIEGDDSPEAKALSEQWKDYAYGQIALNQPIEVNKPIHDLTFQEPAPGTTQPTETPLETRPEDYVTPVDTQGVKIPAMVPPVEKGPESEIKGIPDLLFEWTSKKPSRILDQEKYSPEKLAEQFNISTDLAKTALGETKKKLIADVERKLGNLERHPDVVNRGQRGPEETATRPVKNYIKLLNQYSDLTGRQYDSTSQGGLHGEVQPGQEPGGGVPGPENGGGAVGPGGTVQGQAGSRIEDKGSRENLTETQPTQQTQQTLKPSLTPSPVNLIRREDGKLYASKPEEQAQADAHVKEAEKLGLVFNGLQPGGMAQFTDKESGKAFTAQAGQVEAGLNQVRGTRTEVKGGTQPVSAPAGLPISGNGPTPLTGNMHVVPSKIIVEGGLGNVKRVGDLLDIKTLQSKGFNSLDIPSQRMVLSAVLSRAYDPKILDSIVGPDAVDMVNMLSGKKISAKMLRNNPSMLKNLLSVSPNIDVAIFSDPATVQRFGKSISAVADLIAETPVGSIEMPGTINNSAASKTQNLGVGGSKKTPTRTEDTLLNLGKGPTERLATELASQIQKETPENEISPNISQEQKNVNKTPTERRTDQATRKKIEELTPEEIKRELLTDHLTGLPNKRAYEESEKKAVQVSIDVDSLKWINDHFGHEVGDDLLKAVGQALGDQLGTGDRPVAPTRYAVYHVSGDEFIVQGDLEFEIDAILALVSEKLKKVTLKYTAPDGTVQEMKGIGISYGKGQNLEEADRRLRENKQERETLGERARRGERPPGVVQVPAQGREVGGKEGLTSDLVRVMDVYGSHHYVKRMDLASTKTQLRKFTPQGVQVEGKTLHRDNIVNESDTAKVEEAKKTARLRTLEKKDQKGTLTPKEVEEGKRLMGEVYQAKKPFQAKTILSWVKAQGGIWDESLPGETNQFIGKESGVIGLLSKGKGKTFDELAALAKDYGWIGEDATAKDFIDLLSKDVAASKQGKERIKSLSQDVEKGILKELSKDEADIGERAEELAKEGWKVYGTGNEEMVGNIEKGDRILINGEEYSHVGFGKDGKAILKDGETLRLDVFDKVPVEALKEKGTKVAKVESVEEEKEPESLDLFEAKKQSWEMTREEFAANQGKDGPYVQQQRDAVVKKAYKEGLPVPENVLAEYPELTPEPPKPKPEFGKLPAQAPKLDKLDFSGQQRLELKGKEKPAKIPPMSLKKGPGEISAEIPQEPGSGNQVYRSRGLEDAKLMRQEEPEGSLANYDNQSKGEWLRGQIPPKDGKLTLYRATPTGEEIKPGDYVTNSLQYAKDHIKNNLGGKGKVTSLKATLDDIYPADGPGEFWYAPKSITGDIPPKEASMPEGGTRSIESYMDDAKKFSDGELSIKSVGYRYGNAPEGGYSFNTREARNEKGVSMASVSGMEESRSFATQNLKEKGVSRKYYEGDIVGYGGDDELIMTNIKEITKKEYNEKLKSREVKDSEIILRAEKVLSAKTLKYLGYEDAENLLVERLKSLEDAYNKTIKLLPNRSTPPGEGGEVVSKPAAKPTETPSKVSLLSRRAEIKAKENFSKYEKQVSDSAADYFKVGETKVFKVSELEIPKGMEIPKGRDIHGTNNGKAIFIKKGLNEDQFNYALEHELEHLQKKENISWKEEYPGMAKDATSGKAVSPEFGGTETPKDDLTYLHAGLSPQEALKNLREHLPITKEHEVLFERLYSNPWYMAKKHPEAKGTVDVQLRRDENRRQYYSGTLRKAEPFFELKGKDLDALEKKIIEWDAQGKDISGDPTALAASGLNPQQIEAYKAVRKVLNQVNDDFRTTLIDAQLVKYRNEPFYQGLKKFAHEKEMPTDSKILNDPGFVDAMMKLTQPLAKINELRNEMGKIKGYFIWVPSRKAWQSKGKANPNNVILNRILEKSGIKERVTTAPETTATETQKGTAIPSSAVADWVQARLEAGEDITKQDLFAQADSAFNGKQSEGKYTPKDAFDALEMGINRFISDSVRTMAAMNPNLDWEYAKKQVDLIRTHIMDKIPSQAGIRTAEMDEFQQFSTPPDLAYVMAWAAHLSIKKDVVLEPSAGVGGIATFAKKIGVKTIVNEFSPRRAALLKEMGFDRVFTENAEQLNNILPADVQPTVVLMNPPFSSTAGRVPGERSSMNVIKHLDQAFKRLEDGGRMVALIGKGWFPDSRALTDYLSNIVDNHNLRANIIVSGKNYAKYGTTYDNRILVIDKTAPDGKPTVEGQVEDVKNAISLLQEVRDERSYTEPGQTKPGVQEIPGGKDQGLRPDRPVLPATHGLGTGLGGSASAGQPSNQHPGGIEGTGTGQGLPVSEVGGGRGGISTGNRPGTEGHQPGGPGAETVGKPGLETERPSAGLSPSESAGLELERIKEEEHPTDITDSIYENYIPKKAVIKGSKPHPGPIIESAAMASVDAPEAAYQPHLSQDIIDKGLLSNVQLESVIYAGQAHQEVMPNGQRKGFFIGDGTGVGKGREIAGIILDNWNQGRKKAVWISQNAPLIEDAQRDVKGVGWNPDHVFDFGRIKLRAPVNNPTGVAFLGYDVLRSKKDGATRLDQLINWFGKDYDGVIVFDESHNMGNAIAVKGKRGTTKPSEKALAGLRLQAELPNARVVYVSATGATEVMNFAYAGRLGLWGEGTAFTDAGDFITKVGAGGLAAMELVARDLKALGKYSARSLSYDNVKYDRLTHPLTDTQREIYDELAGAWQVTLQNIDAALEETGVTGIGANGKTKTLNPDAKSAAKAKYWGSHQRFFNQIITSMQMPTVVKAIEKDLQAGKAIVLQLVNTSEAATNRQLSRMEDPEEIEDLDLTPREHLMEYIKRGFPVNQYERYVEIVDGNPVEKSRLVVDSAGNPVLNAEALAMRDALLDRLGSIRVPDNPIDTIINHFGVKNVAEVTGRTKRVIEVDDEKGHHRIIDKRSKAKAMSDADAFMNDQKQILIFSYAGGTGRSYHADLSAANQKVRSHYLLQPGWRADRAVQGLGRTHRTNQAQPPEYHLVTTDLNGQKRFISSIARRLDQLGALTRGQRQTGGQGLFAERDNLESKYAGDALSSLIEDIANGRTEMGLGEFAQQLGLNMLDDQGNLKLKSLPDVPQFLNRILSMQVEPQNRLFDMFSERLDLGIAAAIRSGTMDVGLETIRAKKIDKISEQTVYTEPGSGAKTKFVELELTKDAALVPWDQSDRMAKGGYAQNIKSGRVWALSEAQLTTDHSTGIVSYSYKATGVNFGIHSISREVLDDEEKYKKLTPAQAEKIWNQEYDDHPKEIKERNYLISGILLPIYNRLPEGNARIIRIQTASGEKILGRLIPTNQVQIIKDRLGAETTAVKMTPREVMDGVLNRNLTVELANGWKIVRKKVSGDDRIEVKGADWRQIDMMKGWGAFTERINYETRLFIPTTEDGETIIQRMMQNNPILATSARQSTADILATGQGNGEQYSTGPQKAAYLVSIDNIRKAYKGQEVIQTDEGYRVKTHGNQFFEIREVDHISDNLIAFETSYGRQRAGDEIIAGSYKKGRIKLVKGVANNWVLSHESVHFMEDAGIITPGEAGLLENHIKGLVKQGKFETANKEKIGGPEDRANFMADQLNNPDPEAKGFIKKIVARIQEFIDRLVNAFGGRTVQGITRDIGTGKIFNREGFEEYGQPGEGEQATFAGRGAIKAESAMARIADAMEKEGSTPEEIWKSTGWIKGKDKLWRFELDDSQAKVATRDELYKISWGTAKDMAHGDPVGAFLKDVLTYPDLFENYPQIAGVWVRLLPDTKEGSLGKGEITKTPTITVGYNSKTGIIDKSVLFHEIQHFIQEQEGFARGGSVKTMKDEISLSAREDADRIKAIVQKAETIRLSDEFKKADQDYINAGLTDEALNIRNASAPFKGYFGEWNKLEKFAQKYGSPGNPLPMGWFNDLAKDPLTAKDFDKFLAMHRDAFELYQKLAGEAEAREVQNRLGWTAQQRTENPPTWDGIPEKDLILRNRQGGMSETSASSVESFAVLKSRTDLDQAKVDTEISNFDKSFFTDSMATIKDMARNWGKAERVGRLDTSLMGRFFGSPEFTFEKVPALKKVVTYNLERADLRVGKFNDLISDPAGRDLHEGVRALQKERPEEYKRLGELLVRADQNKRVYNAESIRKMGFSDQAVAAWADARAIMDNGFDRQIASYQEMVRRNAEAGLPAPSIVVLDEKGHPKEVSVKTAIAMMGEMRGWYWPRLRDSGAYQIVAKATPEMKAQGLHNRLEFKDFFVEHRVAQLRQQGYQVEYFKSKSIPEDLFAIYGKVMGTEQMINEALNRSLQAVGNKSNFQFSDMGIKAMWSTSTDEKPDFMLDTKKVPQERLAKIMPVIRAMGGRWYSAQKGEPKYWHFVGAEKSLETRLRRSLSRYDNRLLAVEEEFARALTTNVANIEKGRGFRSSMIQRGPEVGADVWEGYEQDPLKAMTSYASRLAAGEAKKETALKMIRAFNGTEKSWAQFKAENEEAEYEDYMKYVESQKVSPTEQKNAYHDGLTYIQEALRNPEMADRVVGTVKGLANFKYLGFRVAAPLVNMTALITSVPAAMQGYAGISLPSTFKWLGKGADLWRQYRHPENWSTLPAETQAAFHIIQHKGWADSQYNREAMEVLKSKVGRGWTRVMEWSMWMFATTEQLNRVATLMGTFAAIREREAGGSRVEDRGPLTPERQAAVEQAMETAKRVSDRAHGVYGPATIPAIAQGKGPAGMVVKSLYMFKKFQHNYLQTLYELGWKQSNWKAATYMMAAPTLLAGAGAFPIPWAWDVVMGILKHLFGWDDPEEKFYSGMEKALGDYIGGIPRQGIAGVGGHLFDMRASLGVGKLDMPTNMIELLGAPGSVFSDVYQGGANILKGNVWKGTEKVMPRAIGTVLQGYREATEGVTTKTNAPVFFGREQIKENFLDAALKSLSFNPARIQKMKDIEWSEKGIWRNYKDRRGDIESGFLKFYLLPGADRDKGKLIDLIDGVKEYNERVRSHGLAGVEPMITSESLKMYISRNLKPSKKEIIKDRNRTL